MLSEIDYERVGVIIVIIVKQKSSHDLQSKLLRLQLGSNANAVVLGAALGHTFVFLDNFHALISRDCFAISHN